VVRKGDTVARLGGDEFAIICAADKGETAEGGRRLATRIINAVKKPITVGTANVEVGACVGIAQYPADGGTGEILLHAADIAMYRAKHEGRGAWRFFEASMDVEIREQAELEAEVRVAVAAGVIEPYYQPLIDLNGGHLLGFEILARWNHPTRGFVPPETFIPLVEKVGLIDELTFALLRQAATEAKTWPGALSLALNIAPGQLTDGLLPVRILSVLNEVGFPPGRLEIELTENGLVTDLEAAKSIISSFQNIGIRVALDDFGTGYSSLHHLRELHFDKIKIDRSFVQSMRSNKESQKIITAILGLAKSLGLPATAEGIEDADALAEITRRGAEYGQGFFFGKAMPAGDIRALIETYQSAAGRGPEERKRA
jgi:predicted signal transduction protein with EAL and GGDEF domain